MATPFRLPPLPSVADILKLYHLRARKQLAQNFLLDERLTNKIVRQAGSLKNSCVMEVGPGPGGLTRSIMKTLPKKMIVVEKDMRFKPTLEMLAESFAAVNGKMDIVYDDIMKTDMTSLFPQEYAKEWEDMCPNTYIIGNLPFNVSTPLIIQWLRQISTRSGPWALGRTRMCLTFQKEVAERLVAPPVHPQRCRLSIMAQAFTKPKLRFIIRGRAFIPKPDVDVGVVTFEPLRTPKTNHEFSFFEKVTRIIFAHRQKYSLACVKNFFPTEYQADLATMMFKLSDLEPTTRPMQFEVEDIDRLCSAYKYLIEKHPEISDYNYRSSRKVLPSRFTKSVVVSEMENNDTGMKVEDDDAEIEVERTLVYESGSPAQMQPCAT